MRINETKKCRVCGEESFANILDLGTQKVANYFHDGSEELPGAPLVLVRCTSCGMVQLTHSVDTDAMYRRYWYRSGINQTMRSHLQGIADEIMSKVSLDSGDAVVDIGCNDGTLLSYFPDFVDKIGVDPSNITPTGCKFVHDYFTSSAVEPVLDGKTAKVVSSIAMFYDLDSPRSFVKDVRSVLADDGLWVLELSYLPRMIENAAYDSVCHEHVAYYSLRSFMRVIEGSGLSVVDVKFNDINGGSFRLFLSPSLPASAVVEEVLDREDAVGYHTAAPYEVFTQRVRQSRSDLIAFLEETKAEGKKVYGYGASTKGQIVLQFCELDPSYMVAIAERNPRKYGLLTPGTDIPICPEDEMRAADPDFLIIFPWYFLDEFLTREQELQDGGCRLVVPLPEVKVL